ncbi:MAG: class I SAM-dependent methyltransferase, partial [Pyrinomonadaceae bacterium]|nr:class I SAM-dependent methyltransferase [Pyrinomonadaceae bacterium]
MNSEGSKSHYLNRANAREYFEARRGLRGDFLVQKLCRYVGRGSSVLELGSGPGNDLPLLSKFFKITASDYSPHFVEFIKEDHPGIEALQLDAVTIDTDLRFDAIYSNKVLHHFGNDEITQSLRRQSEVL